MRKRGTKPRNNIKLNWTPKLAYVIGLIASDGNLSKDGRHIIFTSKDLQLAELFKKCLGLKAKIGKKARGAEQEKKYFYVQFSNVLFYRWLEDIGLTKNKSKTIGKLKISDKYFFDFLRGCYDGDGCMYSYWDPRWHSSFMFYLSVASASRDFLVWIQATVYKLIKVEGKIGNSNQTFYLRFAKTSTRAVFKKMFYKKKLPCLHRKLNKAKYIFKKDDCHNIK